MGLKKQIILENGITLNYHRIVSVNKITNNSTILEIASYINQEKREIERTAIQNGEAFNVFKNTIYTQKEYNETETIQDLYDYLKTTETFKDAENA